MTFFRAILISAFCALVSVPVFGAVDPREAVDWSKYPQVVHVQAFVSDELFSSCTGQYVAPNLILTAAHCILSDGGNLYGNINVVTYAGKKCAAQQAFWVGNYLTADNSYPYDFAVLQIEPECYSSINYKKTRNELNSII
jgi:V8-like Glu-specific endopeptidase